MESVSMSSWKMPVLACVLAECVIENMKYSHCNYNFGQTLFDYIITYPKRNEWPQFLVCWGMTMLLWICFNFFSFTFHFSQVPNKSLLTCFLLKHEFRRKLKKKINSNESFIHFYASYNIVLLLFVIKWHFLPYRIIKITLS